MFVHVMHILVDYAKTLLEKGVLQVLYVLFDSRKGIEKNLSSKPKPRRDGEH
jgi:hypothetical protein